MRTPVIPKGKAMALHLTPEYEEGKVSTSDSNPYCFWNDYLKYYSWDIGRQERNKQ